MFNFYFVNSSEIMFLAYSSTHTHTYYVYSVCLSFTWFRFGFLWFRSPCHVCVCELFLGCFYGRKKHFNLCDEMNVRPFSARIQFNSMFLSPLCRGIHSRRIEVTRGIQVHNLGKIDKQLHVAAKSDHKTFTEKRLRRIYVHQCQCIGETRCSYSTTR